MSIDLSVDSLLKEAIEKTGFEDFGGDTFKEGLNILIHSCLNESQLNDFGYNFITNRITQFLINRLHTQDWIIRHSEILDEKIERPLFILGLPRTGSTFLQTLLSIDPANRALHHWEANEPCPPPELIHSATDPRIHTMHKSTQMIELIKPELQAIYPIDTGGFAECQMLLANEFKSEVFNAWLWAPTYIEWLLNCDMSSAYTYHKRLLQLLQWRLPNEGWILKAPMHLIGLNALLNQYPDAQIIFTHRDPLKVVTSFASLISAWNSLFSDKIDNKKIGGLHQVWALSIEKAMKVRDQQESKIFYDLQFQDLIANPISSVKRIYEHFGRKVSAGHERRMQVWIRDNPKGKRGSHRYSVEKFGTDPTKIRKRFAIYQERFKVTLEK